MIYTVKLLNSKAIREKRKVYKKTVTTSIGKEIVEHFIFDLTISQFEKKFT